MSDPSLIRRRHVFYVAGYDPQGNEGYYALFRREFERFKMLWPIRGSLTPPEVAADAHCALWRIETSAPNWQVTVDYEFLSWDDIILRDLARPMRWRFARALAWLIDDIGTGTMFRIFRGSWRFGLFFIYPLVALALWLACAVAAGWATARVATALFAAPTPVAFLAGIVVAYLVYRLLRLVAESGLVILFTDLWIFFRDLASGRRQDFDARIDIFAQRLVAAIAAADADEVVVVGHSGGGVVAPLVVARALTIDPALGRRGSRLVLLTLGSILPAIAMHSAAGSLREVLRRLALEPALLWIDCQSRKDVVNFFNFDPIAGVGIDAGAARQNPIVLPVRFRDALVLKTYHRVRWRVFRMHFQFIMANDRRAAYDYYLYLCGPLPLVAWTEDRTRTIEEFGPDASLRDG